MNNIVAYLYFFRRQIATVLVKRCSGVIPIAVLMFVFPFKAMDSVLIEIMDITLLAFIVVNETDIRENAMPVQEFRKINFPDVNVLWKKQIGYIAFNQDITVNQDEIPVNSILREFIGGCCFYKDED